jgi:MYXO-CTERM domain-containing protein
MTARILAEELTGEGRDADGHTYLGLGLMALILLVLWLIRRSKA